MTPRLLAPLGVLAALVPAVGACAEKPAAAPPDAQVTIASRIVVPSCPGSRPRQVPLRVAVLLEGGGRRMRVTTGVRGTGSVHLAPGRYAVAPARPTLRRAVVSLRLDGTRLRASRGEHVVNVAGGPHRIVVLLALRPGECNGSGALG
jgi:hypothetical protein